MASLSWFCVAWVHDSLNDFGWWKERTVLPLCLPWHGRHQHIVDEFPAAFRWVSNFSRRAANIWSSNPQAVVKSECLMAKICYELLRSSSFFDDWNHHIWTNQKSCFVGWYIRLSPVTCPYLVIASHVCWFIFIEDYKILIWAAFTRNMKGFTQHLNILFCSA